MLLGMLISQLSFDLLAKARFRRRFPHVPNLADELSTARERCLNRFGTAVLVWCGRKVKFHRMCRTFFEFNLGSTYGAPQVALQSRTYSIRFDT